MKRDWTPRDYTGSLKWATSSDGDQDQEEVEAQIEDAHGGQSPPQRLTRSMFKALGTRWHIVFLLQLPFLAYTFSCLSLLFHWFCGGCFWDWCGFFDIFHLRIPRPQDQIGARTLFLWEWPIFLPQIHFGSLLWNTHCFANF